MKDKNGSKGVIKINVTKLKHWLIGGLVIASLIVIAYLILQSVNNPTNQTNSSIYTNTNLSPLQNEYIPFYFVDSNTNCSLEGDVSINDNEIGTTQNGVLDLNELEYSNLSTPLFVNISGLTGSCFGKDSGLRFMTSWTIDSLQWYFDNNQSVIFNTSLYPRHPQTLWEAQGFIRPDEVVSYYNNEVKKYMKNDTVKDLNFIATYFDSSFNYRSNGLLFGDPNYWRTPAEVLNEGMGGDCKNWAVTVLSLMEVYNSSLKCYDVLWEGEFVEGHVNVLCYFGNRFVIYDEGGVSSMAILNTENDTQAREYNKIQVRQMLGNYYSEYGLSSEDRIYALISDTEIIPFSNYTSNNTNEDFINWAINQPMMINPA